MNDKKNIKKSSKDKNLKKKRKYIDNNLLINNKNKGKNLSDDNVRNSTTNLKTETKNDKKDYKFKLNHINLKSIIKKIDLYSLSLSKRPKKIQKIKHRKDKNINNDKNKISNFIKLNFDKPQKEKNSQKIKYIRKHVKNPDKFRNYKNINNTSGNLSEQNYKNENTGDDHKLKPSKLFIKNHDKENHNIFENKILIKHSQNLRTIGNKTFNKKTKNNISKIKNNKLCESESELCINKTKKTEENTIKTKKIRFRRNNTEIGRLNLNLENINTSPNNFSKNNSNITIKNKIKKKKLLLNGKKILINMSNTIKKLDKKKINNLENLNSITKQLKNYVLTREVENINIPNKVIIQNKKEINSSRKRKKENYKNKIPKPIITISNKTYINTNEISNKNNYTSTKVSISHKSYVENKRHFSTDILDNRIDYSIKKTESDYFDENIKKTKNYLINDALINIRELSIPGRTKDGKLKVNQDSYLIQRDINFIKNFNIFTIFDGHGFNGHIISEYLKENLIKKIEQHPQIKLLKNLEYIYSQFIKNNYKIIREIFYELDNELLNNEKLIDINLSGSTCILIIQIGDNIISTNIGDSKAILVYEDKNISTYNDEYNKYKYFQLSRDCTPYIETEKIRILMNGGNVIQLKNKIEPEKGPLKIFLKDDNIPGLSITRSFGDRIGKSIGMISNPVINEYTLNKDVKFIIIASSGVWKFIKEKDILNYGIKSYLSNDPDNFCNIIANKASELFNQNIGNIDDITIIVIFLTFI